MNRFLISSNRACYSRQGLTLIELLVVISILAIITAMAVPRLRMLNEDRFVREAARMAASTFAAAANRVLINGEAGVCIETNPNIVDADGVQYAGTALYVLQAVVPVPVAEDAERLGNDLISITAPYGHSRVRPMVIIGDRIKIGDSQIQYLIEDVQEDPNDPLRLILKLASSNAWLWYTNGTWLEGFWVRDFPGVMPSLPVQVPGQKWSYVVYRSPRIKESSRVELPEGYIIDMRYSGPIFKHRYEMINDVVVPYPSRYVLPESGMVGPRTIYHDPPTPWPSPPQSTGPNRNARFYFGNGLERITSDRYLILPSSDIHLFIAKFEPDPAKESIRTIANNKPDSLDNPTNLWLTISQRTGGVTVSPNASPNYQAAPDPNTFWWQRIEQARALAKANANATD